MEILDAPLAVRMAGLVAGRSIPVVEIDGPAFGVASTHEPWAAGGGPGDRRGDAVPLPIVVDVGVRPLPLPVRRAAGDLPLAVAVGVTEPLVASTRLPEGPPKGALKAFAVDHGGATAVGHKEASPPDHFHRGSGRLKRIQAQGGTSPSENEAETVHT